MYTNIIDFIIIIRIKKIFNASVAFLKILMIILPLSCFSLNLLCLPVLRFLCVSLSLSSLCAGWFLQALVVFASLLEVVVRWRLNIGGFYRSCSSYSLGGTHFMVFFFLCSYVTEAVKCWGRLFSKNFFQKFQKPPKLTKTTQHTGRKWKWNTKEA